MSRNRLLPEEPETSERDVGRRDDDAEMELLRALDDVRFEFTSEAIRDIMTPPPLDPRLASFIDSYAKYCADLFAKGAVPAPETLESFVKLYFRTYKHKPVVAQSIKSSATKRRAK